MKHVLLLAALSAGSAFAAPTVTRLTPPSELFASGRADPVIARFLPGQRFDLQASIKPDAGQKITAALFLVDGKPVAATVALRDCASGCLKGVDAATAIATVRAVSSETAGKHEFSVEATQADGQKVIAKGNFEVVPFAAALGPKVKNIIILLGDGMGASQRTAARIVHGYAQGKALQPLAMDTFTATALVKTASLNSIVTDSSPGMSAYVSGNKNNNNEEGVFPDDTVDAFDNPRIEYLSEYLHRTQGKQFGIVTTADVFDATPAANAVHTSNRGAGTGIVDQFFDDRGLTGLTVLMGGGRKWFLPAGTPGSARTDTNDYAFSPGDDLVKRWGASAGSLDKQRDLIKDFQAAGFSYAPTKAALDKADATKPLLGLFAFSNMNVALDKINGRRGSEKNGLNGGSVVDDFGLPDQPMLDEMATKALSVLKRSPKGFVLMVEGASIDKQAHAMDTERWMLDTLEFDRAVRVAQDFAAEQGDTLVIVTADHECSGAALIGGATVTDKALAELAAKKGVANLRNGVVGTYEKAGFPRYRIAADGYPETTDIDYRLLVGYGANADRYEDWRTKKTPQRDVQQPFAVEAPLKWYPANAQERDDAQGDFLVTGQVPGEQAVHTATDVPLSAYGPGALAFTGVIDNTDVFFKLAQAAVKGVVAPADTSGAKKPPKPKR
ncbi:alkaline phosphatase [Roseateles sp. P5_E7]